MTRIYYFQGLCTCVMVLLLVPSTANAIFSQPSALVDAGPVRVNVDIEISEAARLLPSATLRQHVENHLHMAGVPVIPDDAEQQLPNVLTPSEREPAQIWVHVAARRISEPSGYLVSLEVSHLQPIMLRRLAHVPIQGLGWHESWAMIVPDDADLLGATTAELDALADDFVRDYESASHPQASQ
jgi:hypothetical protein